MTCRKRLDHFHGSLLNLCSLPVTSSYLEGTGCSSYLSALHWKGYSIRIEMVGVLRPTVDGRKKSQYFSMRTGLREYSSGKGIIPWTVIECKKLGALKDCKYASSL